MGPAEYSTRGAVAVITLNNPPVNGLGHALRRGIVEGLEVLAAGDQCLTEGPVDVVLAGQVDVVEPDQRVGEPPWADLEPRFPQDASERDDVADDGVGHA